MLRSFHYIDEKGKDQGINGEPARPHVYCYSTEASMKVPDIWCRLVRNRASEIASMLGDVEKIRQERRKAKSNKAKYQGQGNDGGMSFVTSGGSRYGGFGSESVGGGGGGGDYEGDDGMVQSTLTWFLAVTSVSRLPVQLERVPRSDRVWGGV
jgi:epsin